MLAKIWMSLWTWTMAGVCLSLFLSFELDARSYTWVSATWAWAGLSTSALLMALDELARRRFGRVRPGARFVVALAVGVLVFPFVIHVLSGLWPDYVPPATDRAKQLRDVLALSTLNFGAWSLGYLFTEASQARERAEREAAQLALELLEQQLHPHFLFNAINTLSGVVEEDPPRAQRLLRELSDLLHCALERRELGLVPVERELELLSPYLALERARWEDELEVRVDVSPQVRGALVPWMSMQTLMENAIKHSTSVDGGVRRVALDARVRQGVMRVSVSNSGRLGVESARRGAGVGLRNLEARLRRLYDGDVELRLEQREGLVWATMCVPMEVR